MPSNDHIIGAGRHVSSGMDAQCFAQPAPHAIANNGIADLLGHGKADPWRRITAMGQNFKQKKRPAPLFAPANKEELGSVLEPNRCRNAGPAFARHDCRLFD